MEFDRKWRFFFISFKESFFKGYEGKYSCELIKEFNTNIFRGIQSFKARIYKIDSERDWNGFVFSILIGKTFRGFAFAENLIHLVRVNQDLLIKIVMMHYNDKYICDYNFIIDKLLKWSKDCSNASLDLIYAIDNLVSLSRFRLSYGLSVFEKTRMELKFFVSLPSNQVDISSFVQLKKMLPNYKIMVYVETHNGVVLFSIRENSFAPEFLDSEIGESIKNNVIVQKLTVNSLLILNKMVRIFDAYFKKDEFTDVYKIVQKDFFTWKYYRENVWKSILLLSFSSLNSKNIISSFLKELDQLILTQHKIIRSLERSEKFDSIKNSWKRFFFNWSSKVAILKNTEINR